MRVFLDASVLSEKALPVGELIELSRTGQQLSISVISHFEVLWGYALAGMDHRNYGNFLAEFKVEVIPLVKTDAESAARASPSKRLVMDALVASSVSRLDGMILTRDEDFLKFVPKDRVRLIR